MTLPLKAALGSTLALMLLLVAVTVSKNREISDLKQKVTNEQTANAVLRYNNLTLKNNELALQSGVDQCNASVQALATKSQALDAAGAAALAEVKKAGAAVDRKVAQIAAMPRTTCEDAFAILKTGASQ